MIKESVPNWDALMEDLHPTYPQFASAFLSAYPRAVRPGKVSVIFGRAREITSRVGMYLAEQIALCEEHLSRSGALVFCTEQSTSDYLEKMTCARAGINLWKLQRNLYTGNQQTEIAERYEKARQEIDNSNLFVVDASQMDVDEMCDAVLDYNRAQPVGQNGLGLVIIDGLLGCSCRGCDGGPLGWSLIGSRLARMARNRDVPVVILATAQEPERLGLCNALKDFGQLGDFVESGFSFIQFGKKGLPEGLRIARFKPLWHLVGGDWPDHVILNFDCETRRLIDPKQG